MKLNFVFSTTPIKIDHFLSDAKIILKDPERPKHPLSIISDYTTDFSINNYSNISLYNSTPDIISMSEDPTIYTNVYNVYEYKYQNYWMLFYKNNYCTWKLFTIEYIQDKPQRIWLGKNTHEGYWINIKDKPYLDIYVDNNNINISNSKTIIDMKNYHIYTNNADKKLDNIKILDLPEIDFKGKWGCDSRSPKYEKYYSSIPDSAWYLMEIEFAQIILVLLVILFIFMSITIIKKMIVYNLT